MQKSSTQTKRTKKARGRRVSERRKPASLNGTSQSANPRSSRRKTKAKNPSEHQYVIENGRPKYVLVPVDEYEQLIKADMVKQAVKQIESKDDDFVDADDLALQIAGDRIARARKSAGLTQQQLAKKLNIPQSQISRIERNPDHTTIRTLKRVAKALKVDVRALV